MDTINFDMFKVYPVLADESGNKDNYLRIIDDSGEDYLYPAGYFVMVELPEIAQKLWAEVS